MPLKAFQRNYWLNSDTAVAPVRVTTGGYPAWQVSVIASLWGAVGAYVAAAWAKLRWTWGVVQRLWKLPEPDQRVVIRVLDVIEHPAYPGAQAAVRKTATTLGFNKPEAWKSLSHALKLDVGNAENTFRHLNTVHLLRTSARAQGSTLTNPDAHLLSELAYQDFALRGR